MMASLHRQLVRRAPAGRADLGRSLLLDKTTVNLGGIYARSSTYAAHDLRFYAAVPCFMQSPQNSLGVSVSALPGYSRIYAFSLAVALVVSKLLAAVALMLVAFGYLFFFGSHTPGTHVYFVVTAIALLLVIAVGPEQFRLKPLKILFGLSAAGATVVGLLRVKEHLSFFEGPEYGAAAMTGCTALLVWLSFVCLHFIGRVGHDA